MLKAIVCAWPDANENELNITMSSKQLAVKSMVCLNHGRMSVVTVSMQ